MIPNLGFNFNINYPVRKIWIKTEKRSRTTILYRQLQSVRNIELGKLDKYINSQNTVCGGLQRPFCCNALSCYSSEFSIGDLH
jgi:hypothetical protein